MLLRNRIKFPLLRKHRDAAKPQPTKRPRIHCSRQLPYEIQFIICDILLSQDPSNKFAITAMRVCSTWANYICERLYSHFQFKNYIQFIGFVNTISLENSIFPYGNYVQEIDLTPVNRYGIDLRMKRVILYCPNLIRIKLGDTTSVSADTIQLMGRFCNKVKSLEMGGMISFPFMFDCDFSGMTQLRSVSLLTTPLQATSLTTLPTSIQHFSIAHMDAIRPEELILFLKQHPQLVSLAIRRCRHLSTDFVPYLVLLSQLNTLELAGPDIQDANVKSIFDLSLKLHTLKLCRTKITHVTLEALVAGRFVVQHLVLENNSDVSQHAIDVLLKERPDMEITVN
ncbi:hypothetical protein A0J61_07307 [Choanephora cucurbitarum]|uniref:F-box domain-containing protein n=1 Tax=Choanephora cucurbitarum TaxID=101091 RepID=A0A1C7NBC9_9FUNG|nr:hypothetical protein A0J61_07307 [Choanephora cucurbitarum]